MTRVTANSFPPVVLRNGVDIEDPVSVVLGFLKAPGSFDVSDPSRPTSFGEADLGLANRAGARISAAQIAAILERRRAIEQALQAIAPDASLTGAADSLPWLPLRQLFGAFADIRGVGLSKMTKALYPKRPALIPMPGVHQDTSTHAGQLAWGCRVWPWSGAVAADQVTDQERHRDSHDAQGELRRPERSTGRPVSRPTAIPPLAGAMAVSAREAQSVCRPIR